jgi:hypothetical protein
MYRINPMHRVAEPLSWVGFILSILSIDVKNLRDMRRYRWLCG